MSHVRYLDNSKINNTANIIGQIIAPILFIVWYIIIKLSVFAWHFKRLLTKLILGILVIIICMNNLTVTVSAPKSVMANDGLLTSKQDQWIYTYVLQYQRPDIGKSISLLRYQMACLAHKENGYHANNHCGDGGLACGMYQYHEATYQSFRKQMIAQGETDHIGSRLDDEDAIHTTVWALTHGYENHWGPILRGECR